MSSKSKYDAGIPNTMKVYRRHECKVLHIADLDLLNVFMLNALVSQQKNPRLIVPQHCCCRAGLMGLQPGPNVFMKNANLLSQYLLLWYVRNVKNVETNQN